MKKRGAWKLTTSRYVLTPYRAWLGSPNWRRSSRQNSTGQGWPYGYTSKVKWDLLPSLDGPQREFLSSLTRHT